jgi:endonuclease YncB( thermonuclease family)
MFYSRKLTLILFFIISLSFPAYAEGPPPITGRVVAVSDGDTVKIVTPQKEEITIRFAEIDAPEKDQPYGQKSKQALSDLVFNKEVKVVRTDIDRYGRTVGRVYEGEKDINKEMVKAGAAWAYLQYLTDQSIVDTETEAKAAKVGLWALQADQIIAPWEWRKAQRVARNPDLYPSDAEIAVERYMPVLKPAEQLVSAPPPATNTGQSCGTKSTCKQMSSCAEARFYLTQCGLSSLDRDGDGRPCEALCK